MSGSLASGTQCIKSIHKINVVVSNLKFVSHLIFTYQVTVIKSLNYVIVMNYVIYMNYELISKRVLCDSCVCKITDIFQLISDSHKRLALYLCTPLQPELEYVVVSAALNDFIARVVLDVVQLVRHEQVLRAHLVAAEQQPLWYGSTQKL